jgi:predicted DNA-binding antitoxin AbrB/MazE fold protein
MCVMADSVDADFEDGVLRPLRPLGLHPGERVRLVIYRHQSSDLSRWDLSRLGGAQGEDLELAEAGLSEWAAALEAEDAGGETR